MNSQASTVEQVEQVVALANREGLYDAADWFSMWMRSNRYADRYRSLAGDFWNLAHEAAGELGAYWEGGAWHYMHIEGEDRRLTALRLTQAIEDYDQLQDEERTTTTGGATGGDIPTSSEGSDP